MKKVKKGPIVITTSENTYKSRDNQNFQNRAPLPLSSPLSQHMASSSQNAAPTLEQSEMSEDVDEIFPIIVIRPQESLPKASKRKRKRTQPRQCYL